MNVGLEFSKIKSAFVKVRKDMKFLSDKIASDYDQFMNHHKKLSDRVEKLSQKVFSNTDHIRENHLKDGKVEKSDVKELNAKISELKKEVHQAAKDHEKVVGMIDDVSNTKREVKDLKNKLNSSELEIKILKEKISQKNFEIKQVKQITKDLFLVVDELSKVELELLNKAVKSTKRTVKKAATKKKKATKKKTTKKKTTKSKKK